MARNKKNNFSNKIKTILALRVGFRCSKPGCNRITCGPDLNNEMKFLNLGEAAHISAASSLGPRFDPKIESSSINNGIWLCRHHANLIDKDSGNFSAETLKNWKKLAESNAYKLLEEFNLTPNQTETLINIGANIFFYGNWKSVDGRTWTFNLSSFLKGSFELLREFSTEFENLDDSEKYVIVETQGNGQLMLKAPVIIDLESGKSEIKLVIAERLERKSLEDIGQDIAFTDEGDIRIENGDFAVIEKEENAFQMIQTILSSQIGDDIDYPFAYSHFINYYEDFFDDHLTLNSLLKIEVARLSTVPYGEKLNKTNSPLLSFINRILDAKVIHNPNEKNKLKIFLKIEFSDKSIKEKTIKLFYNT